MKSSSTTLYFNRHALLLVHWKLSSIRYEPHVYVAIIMHTPLILTGLPIPVKTNFNAVAYTVILENSMLSILLKQEGPFLFQHGNTTLHVMLYWDCCGGNYCYYALVNWYTNGKPGLLTDAVESELVQIPEFACSLFNQCLRCS